MNPSAQMRTVAVLQHAAEAQHLQQVLQASGIDAFLDGLNVTNSYPVGTLTAIRLYVPAEQEAEAVAILEEAKNIDRTQWYCEPCREINEGSFDLCWKCGQSRADVEGPMPVVQNSHEAVPVDPTPTEMFDSARLNKTYDSNPYAAPRTGLSAPMSFSNVDEESPALVEKDEAIERAYRAAIFGLVTLPIIFHLMSLALAFGALSIDAPVSPKSRSRLFLTFAIDILVLVTTVSVYIYFRFLR